MSETTNLIKGTEDSIINFIKQINDTEKEEENDNCNIKKFPNYIKYIIKFINIFGKIMRFFFKLVSFIYA